MRSPALKLVVLVVLLLVGGEFYSPQAQSNQCRCPDPPGGTVSCEKSQVAICIVKDGRVTTECKSVPAQWAGTAQLNVWILSTALGKDLSLEEVMKSPQYQRMIFEAQLNVGEVKISFATFGPSMKDLPVNPGRDGVVLGPPIRHEAYRLLNLARSGLNVDPTTETGQGDFESTFRRGKQLLDAKQFEQALVEFNLALKIAEKQKSQRLISRAYGAIANTLHAQRRHQDVLAVLIEANNSLPNDAVMLTALGTALVTYEISDKKAEDIIRTASESMPEDSRFLLLWGAVLLNRERYSEAQDVLKSALRLRPNDPEINLILAQTYYRQGKNAEAIAAFKASGAKPPPDLAYELSQAEFTLGNYEAAERMLQQAISSERYNEEHYYQLGRILYIQLKYPEAERAFNQAVRVNPTQPYFFAALGDALFAQHKFDAAKKAYSRALELNPNRPLFRNRLDRLAETQAATVK